MCGINGIFAYHYAANSIDRQELVRTRDHMSARGPDGKGEWLSDEGRVGFGHCRLSIIDLTEAGAQPMVSADGMLTVTFNGEIYNYAELRKTLEARGYRFRSHSDTEVLLHLYAEKGEEMVHDLRGMFAFGLWDARRQALLLVRDPYGIKPLYYADDGWTLRFASQVKALIAGGGVSRDPEPAGLVGFYLLGSVPEPYTTYLEIRSVPAGSVVWVEAAGPRLARRYTSIADIYWRSEALGGPVSEAERRDQLREALLDSVRHHMVADVPVGAFLSAGVDSGALVGLMRDTGQQDIQTVTLAFEEYRGTHDDEAPLAEQVAGYYGTRHTTRIVSEGEFSEDLPKILEAMDQPTINGINTWFVSKAARELGLKAVVSGLGGDELFAGYPSFAEIPRWVRFLAVPSRVPPLGWLFRNVIKAVRKVAPGLNPKTAGLLEFGGSYAGAYLLRRGLFLPSELPSLMDPQIVADGLRRLRPLTHITESIEPSPRNPVNRVAALESSLYMRNQLLRDSDWASMSHSLELRVPLVDFWLLKRVAAIAAKARTTASKSALADAPRRRLPRRVVSRAKTGFTTPLPGWLQQTGRADRWRQLPTLSVAPCPWARRWAYQVADA